MFDFSGNTFNNSLADVQAHATQAGIDVLIDLGVGDSVALIGVNHGDLNPDDVLF